ncbi:MAG: 4-(cytidine 5'-diphospho)-2-C-methyl-D-erythritol kinase, partial [Bacteroidota bacterium]
AAFTLKLLNNFFQLKLNNDELKNYANQIGSDCTFFIDNVPAFASGRGNILEEINLVLRGYYILIVKPDVHISTADAYNNVKPGRPEKSIKEIIEMPITEWSRNFGMKNDFEKFVFEKYPVIAEIKNKIYRQGAIYASMSGSGSAVFGIFSPGNSGIDKDVFGDCIVWEGRLE